MAFNLMVCSPTTKVDVKTSDIDGNLQLAMYKQQNLMNMIILPKGRGICCNFKMKV